MATLIAMALFLQDSIYETRYKHQKDLLAIPGVKTVSVGGVDGTMALVVTVENDQAADSVIAKYGETIDGHRLHVIVSGGRKTGKKTVTEPEKKPTVATTVSIPGTLRDYSIPFFPTATKPVTTTAPEEEIDLSAFLPKPKKTEATPPTTTPESGPSRDRSTSTTTTGPSRTTGTTTTDGPRWDRPTGTTTTGPSRHWTPTGGNTITRSPGGQPT